MCYEFVPYSVLPTCGTRLDAPAELLAILLKALGADSVMVPAAARPTDTDSGTAASAQVRPPAERPPDGRPIMCGRPAQVATELAQPRLDKAERVDKIDGVAALAMSRPRPARSAADSATRLALKFESPLDDLREPGKQHREPLGHPMKLPLV